MRLALDTDVVVAAMRSPSGASAALMEAAINGRVTLLANVALILEYEAVCGRQVHLTAAGLNAGEVNVFVDALAALAEAVESHFVWRPQLRDPSDEMVLEAAINGRADAIVTFDRRDFGSVPERFGVRVLSPIDAYKGLAR